MNERFFHRPGLAPWFRRRLSPSEYLGLQLTLGLLLSLAALALFGLVAHLANGHTVPTPLDSAVSERLREHRDAEPAARAFFWGITQLGSTRWLGGLGLLVALVLLARRHLILSLVWMIALGGGGLIDGSLKLLFQRPRPAPPIRDTWINETTMSFPSGHSMGAVVGYVLLAYLLWRVWPWRWCRVAVVGVVGCLILVIGFSRVYLGAHWLTDVLGGYLAGLVWVGTCIMAIEAIRRWPAGATRMKEPAVEPNLS